MKKIDLSEIIGVLANVGVLAGILFLAYELRQNNRVSRAAAVQSIAEQVIDWQTSVSQDNDWMRIITFLQEEGGTYDELNPQDRVKYQYVVNATIRIMENRYRQVQLGIIDPSELDVGGGRGNNRWYRSEHFMDYWRSGYPASVWDPEFIQFMETEVLELH